ncbi:MAG: short-subunit dehydrogenase [Alteromonas naphthalenivorans]|jgi:short-subunit dehydrogenase
MKRIIVFLWCIGSLAQTYVVARARSPKKIVVIGGVSDIGKALVKELLNKGHVVVAADDNEQYLMDLQEEEGDRLITKFLPIADEKQAREDFHDIIEEIGGLDICILCCSIAPEIEQYGLLQSGHIPWRVSRDTIAVNVMGTTALANRAMNYFIEQQKGYLVGVSSLDALHGHPGCPCYTASKAFMSNYLEAMRQKCSRLKFKDIVVCDIRWSFVNQKQDTLGIGWTEDPDVAAVEILQAVEKRKPVAYIMDRWSFAIWALMTAPTLLKNAFSGISMLKMAN